MSHGPEHGGTDTSLIVEKGTEFFKKTITDPFSYVIILFMLPFFSGFSIPYGAEEPHGH